MFCFPHGDELCPRDLLQNNTSITIMTVFNFIYCTIDQELQHIQRTNDVTCSWQASGGRRTLLHMQ